jgi:DNA-binding XRE family transcriptional regulator
MTTNFENFYKGISEDRKNKIEKRVEEELVAIRLSEVRQLFEMTQKELAEKIGVSQAAISKTEKQDDMNISTLKKFIEGVGGQLEVIVKMPDKPPIKLVTFSSPPMSELRAM